MIPRLKAGWSSNENAKNAIQSKKKIGKGTSIVADKASKGGFTKTSQNISGTGKKYIRVLES